MPRPWCSHWVRTERCLGPIVPTRAGYARGIVRNVTQTPESSAEPTTVTGQPRYDNPYDRPSRLGQVAAWVVIVAGVVFVVTVIFFSGFFLGRSSDGHHGWHRGYYGGRDCTYPMMGPGGMMGPEGMGPGGPMSPQQTPTTSAPTTPRP